MHFLDLTLPSLAENLALDEALLQDAEAGGPPVLRVWSWPSYAVVMGAGGKRAREVDEDACRADGVGLARRSSGGGTVLLGPGCLLYSLILPYDRHPSLRDFNASYRHILGEIARALDGVAPAITPAGISDLASAERKFSGNAQQRKRNHLLHHGTLLIDFNIAMIARYLKHPERQPAYREDRRHESFLMNLPTTAAEVIQRLRRQWRAVDDLKNRPTEQIADLVREKYGRDEWTLRW